MTMKDAIPLFSRQLQRFLRDGVQEIGGADRSRTDE
jgi:hypothetical protein